MVLGFRSGNVGVGRWSSNQSHKLADPLSLFTEFPTRPILGNPYPYARIAYSPRRQMQVNKCLPTDLPGPNQPPIAGCGEAPYACSASFLEEFFSETGLPAMWVLGSSLRVV